MRFAGLAAIAITLIIAVPIILGYGLASEETEYTRTTESGTASLTDTLFNAESDYYIDYTKTSNNSQMLQRVTAQGDNYYVYASPDYVSTGSTYTSVPAYETTTHTTTDSSSDVLHTYSATINSGDPNRTVGSVIGDYDEFTSDWGSNFGGIVSYTHSSSHCTEYIVIDNATTYVFIEGLTDTSLNSMYGTTAGGLSASSVSWVWNEDDDNWIFTVGTTQYTANWAVICCVYHGDYTWNQYDFDTISPVYDGESVDNWTFIVENPAYAKLTYSDGTVVYRMVENSVSHTSAFTLIDNEEMGKPSSVGVSFVGSGVTDYFTQDYTEYANIAYGWYNAEAPDLVNPVYYNAWFNQYENASVTLYIHFEGNGCTEFYEDFTTASPVLTVKKANDTVTIIDTDTEVSTLGTYSYVRVFFDALQDEVVVSGVSSMPPVGGTADLLNTVTVDYDFNGYIEFLKIVDQFSAILPVTADYYVENGDSVTIDFNYPRPYNTLRLRDSDGNYVTSGWSATLAGDYSSANFSPTSLATGLYTFVKISPQASAETFTIYVGSMSSVSTSPISYRVDSANVVAGQYPSTTDYTLNVWSLFPNDTYQSVYINSVGVYGDYLQIAGINYPVENGSITLTDIENGETYSVKVLKSDIVMSFQDGVYTTSVNGHVIRDNQSSAPTIYFGGEWSLTATRSTVTEETAVKTEWVAGEFALDTDGFVLAMCLTAVAAFVVLGMTGARSGAKIALLALICGGACVVGFMMI